MPIAWIALNSIKGLGPVKIRALVEKYNSADEALDRLPEELPAMGAQGKLITKTELKKQAIEQLGLANKLGIKVLTLDSAEYPVNLREIYAPPPVLFVKGNCDVFSKNAIAVVGTRRCTQYGKTVAGLIVKELVEKQFVIVSGLAHGIDTIAHKTCLDNNGLTIAVLGCGIDICYPYGNQELLRRILETGAVVSEFPIGTLPENYNFPRRNRIISGCSAGVLVVEAPEKSGSLITANFALQQGREVFAVPGSIFSDSSSGPFNLIRDGATPVRCAGDIIENIGAISNPVLCVTTQASSASGNMIKMPLDLLSVNERSVFEICSESAWRIDELAEKAGKPINEMFDILLSLELKGLIRQISGQQYIRS
ncbi:MAG TPA: DNA-protecting protein DprA [Fibrobacteres bacterium]|nr:DNA-protecting protein DprA [Fibrobacterota bacterium]